MTNDELERIMKFIIERQERVAEQQAIGAEQLAQASTTINALIERQERIAVQQAVNTEQLAQAEALINALAKRQLEMGEQADDHEERIARFERSYTAISALLQTHDTQIVAMTEGINNLTTTVNRYITARGNGGSEA